MTHDSQPASHPPQWTHAVLRMALPSDSMRDAILGDLHEEFRHDLRHGGVTRAHLRHLSRTAGILSHCLWDTASFRSWGDSDQLITSGRTADAVANGALRPFVRHRRGFFGDASIALLAVVVIALSIVANTMVYSSAQIHGTSVSLTAKIAVVAFFVACIAVAAIAICAGPRWLRNRARRIAEGSERAAH